MGLKTVTCDSWVSCPGGSRDLEIQVSSWQLEGIQLSKRLLTPSGMMYGQGNPQLLFPEVCTYTVDPLCLGCF